MNLWEMDSCEVRQQRLSILLFVRSKIRRSDFSVTSATLDAPHFRGLTGGVYKAQEHIHRGMLTRDYKILKKFWYCSPGSP